MSGIVSTKFSEQKKNKNLSLAGFEHGTLDCEFNALPTWPLQHTEVHAIYKIFYDYFVCNIPAAILSLGANQLIQL